jgi:predicted TIM-barrel fold metal-dependent hydrolase
MSAAKGLDEVFIIDGPIHAMNLSVENLYNERYGEAVRAQVPGLVERLPPPYRPTADAMLRDIGVDETVNMLIRESDTDFGIFHSIANTAFKDGFCSVEKSRAVNERYSSRFLNLVGVDPLVLDGAHPAYEASDPVEEITRRVEYVDADAIKVYPVHYDRENVYGWTVDDPEVAYPIWERAIELGIDTISVHRAFPIGRTPPEMLDPRDVGEAAANFPALDFEIVHGGITFPEEVSMMIATYPNIYANLGITSLFALTSPKRFAEIIEGLLQAGKEAAIEKITWGTECSIIHPQPLLEAFWDVDLTGLTGMFGTVDVTQADKEKILGKNAARLYGLEIDDLRYRIAGDQFSDADELAEPYSTTNFEVADA